MIETGLLVESTYVSRFVMLEVADCELSEQTRFIFDSKCVLPRSRLRRPLSVFIAYEPTLRRIVRRTSPMSRSYPHTEFSVLERAPMLLFQHMELRPSRCRARRRGSSSVPAPVYGNYVPDVGLVALICGADEVGAKDRTSVIGLLRASHFCAVGCDGRG